MKNRYTAVLLMGCLFFCGVIGAPVRAQRLAVPSAPVRKIMTGDRLRVSVVEQPGLDRVYAVAGDGTIDFPMVGRLQIANMTTEAAADYLEQALEKKYFKDATVTVDVAEFVEGAIMVMGAVGSPGSIPFKGGEILTLIEAITMSGGLASDADGTAVRILRWKQGGGMERQVLTVDVQSMFDELDFKNDQFLRPRDIVLVPTLGGTGQGRREFLALGEVGRPGFHPYSDGMDVIRAITRAGGVSQSAQMDAVRLLRSDGQGNYNPVPIDLTRLFGAADMNMNISVQPGDIIFVPSKDQATGGQIYLLGAVQRQGAVSLPLNREATLARTLLRAGGFTEYANDGKVKIIRTAPDGTKQTLTVNVARILKTGLFEEDVPLQNGDVIIVPERMLGF
jgi:polysaccharide export outer membrane protein